MHTEHVDTIVIGAGQAGLAAGYYLARRGHDFLILEHNVRLGENWRKRWDSLRLFTPAIYSSLPGMPFPSAPYHLPGKDEVAAYLEAYAARFGLPVRLNTMVNAVRHEGDRFGVYTDGGLLTARNVIVATGAFQTPALPSFAADIDPTITQVHSSGYRNPEQLPPGPVLVVGAGNSGAQIALELAASREVWLAGPDVGHLPRRILGKDLFWWIWRTMLAAPL
ncbi:MAG TPA: NAD(P)/FAD-dependent oxidoreductase, partial [Rhodothermales bacterium]|nr:NAD(P)/FAD-dependent oxidoreductase [Rhodothermales bacterium]